MIQFIHSQCVPYDELLKYSYEQLRMIYDYYKGCEL
jgi:hypothetical protein